MVAIPIRKLPKNQDEICQIMPKHLQDKIWQLQQALEFELALKGIVEKIRSSLDESEILQSAVKELGIALNSECCNLALYDSENRSARIVWQYQNCTLSSVNRLVSMDDYPEIYSRLLQGQYFESWKTLSPLITAKTSILACPIFDRQGVLGDLWLFLPNCFQFNEMQIGLVQQVAMACAGALRQARLYQASLAQVEELQKINRMKDEFWSTVSHELRAPVSNMKMAIQMLDKTMKSLEINQGFNDGEPRQHSSPTSPLLTRSHPTVYFHILHNECEREIKLINDLLDCQRLEAQAEPLMLEEINLQLWIPHIIEPFAYRIRKQQQVLRVEIAQDLPQIKSDSFSLGRILSELLNNACKYTPAGEEIVVTATEGAGFVQVQVTNFGVEISPEHLPRIFDKFYRVPNSKGCNQAGNGLGLALVQKLTHHLGGTIRVESVAGHTCFTINLPIKVEAA